MSRWKKRPERRCRVSVSPSFVVLLLLFAAVDRQGLLAQILLAAAVHECGHVAALYLGGGRLEFFRITLFGGELRIRHSERLSYGRELAAVLAGSGTNLLCALLLARVAAASGWEQGYVIAGVHALLGLFNLLPFRQLDGGRALYLVISWLTEPVTADRAVHAVSCIALGAALFLCAVLQGAVGLCLPFLLMELWCIVCWCAETGIVKSAETR